MGNVTKYQETPSVAPNQEMLWEQVKTYTRFPTAVGTNEIAYPQEVKGFTYKPEYRDDLLQIIYLMEVLKRWQEFDKKRNDKKRHCCNV